ncbi:assembly protein [Vibrio profundum]|uniref:zonular occludens toxin domain-containing protein n=1 Tax=Vibrio profundum TaxID=2910247 RepID=UPI003D121ACA
MAVYFVTGKLGAGKSLTSVGRIKEALIRGVPVATNLDLNLCAMLGRYTKKTQCYRVPDKPTLQDLDALGNGNQSYDESKNGLLVLDECGTWFNSRTWNDKSRQDVINWFLHARKKGWDIIFIVQDISIVDKQARLALAEHTVFCRRLDRMQIPIVSSAIRIITLGLIHLKLPKLHIGIVKYGDNAQALTVDKWHLWGTELYATYDTKQIFSSHYEDGVYMKLPTWYSHGRYRVPYTARNIMRITKIVARKYSRLTMFTLGSLLSLGVSLLYTSETNTVTNVMTSTVEKPNYQAFNFSGYRITSYMQTPDGQLSFEIDKDGQRKNSMELAAMGYQFTAKSRCHITVNRGGPSHELYC